MPPWAGGPSVGARMINARSETLATSRAFRPSLERRRCIVPADGFYEWTASPGRKEKQAWHLRPADGAPLAFAGLWSSWRPRDADGVRLVTCAIVTTTANATVAPVHDRMPVCLPADAWDDWLDPDHDDVDHLLSLLQPAPEDVLERVPVGPAVGNVANDDPSLVVPVDLPAPAELFPGV